MPTRSEVLEQFGLPDSAAFEMKPERDSQGIWRIKVSCEADAARHMSQGHATRFAEVIRSIDQNLAEQIEACIAAVPRRIVRTAKKRGSVPRSKVRKAVKSVKGKGPKKK